MRLHLGASPAQLVNDRLAPLVTSDWVHLGDPELLPTPRAGEPAPPRGSDDQAGLRAKISAATTYIPFFYKTGDRLPFDDGAFSFVFSEHFFEHLYLDEACELFKECFRVMAVDACLRIAVPDADLRTYLPIEPAGFSTGDKRWAHPDKHKTRWSIYSLGYVLAEIGFRTRGLVYCDKFGSYHFHEPREDPTFYAGCPDLRFVNDRSYVLRFERSLVVDAVKRRA